MPLPWFARVLAPALAAALWASAGPAMAHKSKPTTTWADKAAAQKLFREGSQAVNEGDYTTALAKFEAANARCPSPKLLVDIGTTQRLLGRYAEAAATFEAYLADPAAEKARAVEINRALKEIDGLVGRLKIIVKEPDAEVQIDSKPLAGWKSGDVVRVNPGEHTVVAERPGASPAVRTLRIRAREEREVALEFTSSPEEVLSPQAPIGVAIGSLGAAGLVAFTVTACMALHARNAVSGHCLPGTATCAQEGVDLARRARRLGDVSTGLLIGSAALLGTGLTVYLTAPRAPRQTGSWRVVIGLGEGHLEGTW